MRAVLALVASAGCGFAVPAVGGASDDQPGGGGSNADAGIDVLPVDGCTSFSQQLDTCIQPGGPDLTLTGMNTFNTDTGVLMGTSSTISVMSALVTTSTNGVEVRAWFVGKLTLDTNATLVTVGARPLAIVATSDVKLEGGAMIDAGAGALTACTGGPTKGADNNGGAAGGGGGGYGGAGGHGGNANSDGGGSTGGDPGAASAIPTGPRGGCPGAIGGTGGDPGGAGGVGGGAIYVVSATQLDVKATAGISAGGGGGGGGVKAQSQYGDAGGGGGGSGGMIWIEAPKVRSTGILAANGGGGGEGSGNGSAGRGGTKGTLGVARALGGAGGTGTGTDGGRGGAGAMLAGEQPGNPQAGGGGGGGGGVGFIHVVSPDQMLGAMVSPAAL